MIVAISNDILREANTGRQILQEDVGRTRRFKMLIIATRIVRVSLIDNTNVNCLFISARNYSMVTS